MGAKPTKQHHAQTFSLNLKLDIGTVDCNKPTLSSNPRRVNCEMRGVPGEHGFKVGLGISMIEDINIRTVSTAKVSGLVISRALRTRATWAATAVDTP